MARMGRVEWRPFDVPNARGIEGVLYFSIEANDTRDFMRAKAELKRRVARGRRFWYKGSGRWTVYVTPVIRRTLCSIFENGVFSLE